MAHICTPEHSIHTTCLMKTTALVENLYDVFKQIRFADIHRILNMILTDRPMYKNALLPISDHI